MRVLSDFHHNSLMISTVRLFEERLGFDVYRPIGMEWFEEGFWAINNQIDTAKQFLELGSQSIDGTPPLNERRAPKGTQGVMHDTFKVDDPGGLTSHWACTLDFFKRTKFDYLIASIPAHIPLFKRLIELYQPNAKLIVQVGNNWNIASFEGLPVLASIKPQPYGGPAFFYHQEFDTELFSPTPISSIDKAYSIVNCIEQKPEAWRMYSELKSHLEPKGWELKAYGGQCPDGNLQGAESVANAMKRSTFIINLKDGGDGYGHIIHNAYAVGRPVIISKNQYRGQLAEDLFVDGSYVNLDDYWSLEDAAVYLDSLTSKQIQRMGDAAAARFKEVVDFKKEAKQIGEWLKTI